VAHEDDWIRGRGPDGYEGWVTAGSVCPADAAEADEWQRRATLWSLGTDLLPPDDGAPPRFANRLPWGARARSSTGGRVILPDGAEAMPRDPERLVPDQERATRYSATGSAVVRSAMEWLGAPYAWGGRRRSGVDCSGLAQAVYALHGVDLPRDSGPQREAGHDLAIDSDRWMRLRRGDLLFFAPEGRGITHVAICLGGGAILHAAASNGCVAVDDLRGGGKLASRLRESIVAATRPCAD
jgi:cell wall-associated NlpC family hydrolase